MSHLTVLSISQLWCPGQDVVAPLARSASLPVLPREVAPAPVAGGDGWGLLPVAMVALMNLVGWLEPCY